MGGVTQGKARCAFFAVKCCDSEASNMTEEGENDGEASIRRHESLVLFYAFDSPMLAGADVRSKPLATRRERLREFRLAEFSAASQYY
jgi:ATP-dependent DNA ligase